MALRLVFMGTSEFAVPTLVEIVGGGHEIAAVYTRAPQPAGRGLAPRASPVAREAERLGLAVFTPKTLKSTCRPPPRTTPDGANDSSRQAGAGSDAAAAAAAMRTHRADAAVVVAYGLILPKSVLEAFPLGAFNLHASLLPRWRGSAPIHRAIMAGDGETGVTVMKMEEGLDTGPLAMAERVPIGADATTGDLHDELARRGAVLMLRALAALEKGALRLTPQPAAGATYAGKIEKGETRIDWTKPWQQVHNHCRGLSPFPGAWFELADGARADSGAAHPGRIKVLRTTKGVGSGPPGRVLDDQLTIACGTGAVRLLQLQRAGRRPMTAAEFLRGLPVAPASVLG